MHMGTFDLCNQFPPKRTVIIISCLYFCVFQCYLVRCILIEPVMLPVNFDVISLGACTVYLEKGLLGWISTIC